ncbi:MAG TPA: hypothetical protein V6C65_24580 [Allocoleopsis sp.]
MTSPLIDYFQEVDPSIAEKLSHFNVYQRNYLVAQFHYEKIVEAAKPKSRALKDSAARGELTKEELAEALISLYQESGRDDAWALYSQSRKMLIDWGLEKFIELGRKNGNEEQARQQAEAFRANLFNPEIEKMLIDLSLTLSISEDES